MLLRASWWSPEKPWVCPERRGESSPEMERVEMRHHFTDQEENEREVTERGIRGVKGPSTGGLGEELSLHLPSSNPAASPSSLVRLPALGSQRPPCVSHPSDRGRKPQDSSLLKKKQGEDQGRGRLGAQAKSSAYLGPAQGFWSHAFHFDFQQESQQTIQISFTPQAVEQPQE